MGPAGRSLSPDEPLPAPSAGTGFVAGVVASGQSRSIGGNGRAPSFPSFLQAARWPAGASAGPPSFLPPPPLPAPEPTLVSPLPRRAATHGFRFSILGQAAAEVRPHHSRISSCECASPTPEQKETPGCRGDLRFRLDPDLGCGPPQSGLLENPPGAAGLGAWEPPRVLRGLTFFVS